MDTYYYEHTLTYNGVSKILTKAPNGWMDYTRNYYRHETFHGILRSDTLPLSFVKEGTSSEDNGGFYLITNAVASKGIKAVISYTIKKRNIYDGEFYTHYAGILNLDPKGGYSKERNWVSVGTIDSQKLQAFINNSETNYALSTLIATNGNSITPFTKSPLQCTITPINLYLNAITNGSIYEDAGNLINTQSGSERYGRYITYNLMGERVISAFDNKIYENTTENTTHLTFTLNVDWNYWFWFRPDGGSDPSCDVYSHIYYIVRTDTGTEVTRKELKYFQYNISNFYEDTYYEESGHIDDTFTYDLPAGYYIEFMLYWNTSALDSAIDMVLNNVVNTLQIVEFYSDSSIYVNAWPTLELCQRLVQLQTGETDTSKLVYSDKFGRTNSEFQTYPSNGSLSHIITTSAKAIRRFPDAEVKVNFMDWFKSISRMANISLWYDKVNDRFRIEEKEQVYKDVQILDLGTGSNFKETFYDELYFSNILSGTSEDGKYDELDGILEYNIQSEHSMDMPVSTKLDIRTPYNIDTLTAAFAKRNLYTTTGTTDTEQDDKIVILDCNSSFETIKNSDIGTFTGFLGIEDRLNGNYTPRKCIINNGNWIGSALYTESDGVIQFVNNIKDLIISYNGVSENDSITKAELGTPLFYPIQYDFDFEVTDELITQMDSDPHGYAKVTNSDGVICYGYILNMEIKDFKKTGSCTLIKANTNR